MLLYSTRWMYLDNMQNERSLHKRSQNSIHVKYPEQVSPLKQLTGVDRGQGEGAETANGYRVLFWSDRNVLELDVSKIPLFMPRVTCCARGNEYRNDQQLELEGESPKGKNSIISQMYYSITAQYTFLLTFIILVNQHSSFVYVEMEDYK